MEGYEPISGDGDMAHAHETGDELIVSCCDGGFDFYMAGHVLDTIALLLGRPVVPDRPPTI